MSSIEDGYAAPYGKEWIDRRDSSVPTTAKRKLPRREQDIADGVCGDDPAPAAATEKLWIGGKCAYCGQDNGEHREGCPVLGSETQVPMGVAGEESAAPWRVVPVWVGGKIVAVDLYIYDVNYRFDGVYHDTLKSISVAHNAVLIKCGLPVSSSTTEPVASGEKENPPAPRPMEQQRPVVEGDCVIVDMATFEGAGKVIEAGVTSVLVQWPDNRQRWFDRYFVKLAHPPVSSRAQTATDAGETKTNVSPAPATATEEKKGQWTWRMKADGQHASLRISPDHSVMVDGYVAPIICEAHNSTLSPQPSATDEQIAREAAINLHRSLRPVDTISPSEEHFAERFAPFFLSAIQESKQ